MAYTKKIGRSAKILIDGTDVSNSFRSFRYGAERNQVPVTGFSATGTEENLVGTNAQEFTGEAFMTEELSAIIEPLQRNGTACTISYQPDGLADATREIYSGPCYIFTYESQETVGDVDVVPFAARAATSAGIAVSDWT